MEFILTATLPVVAVRNWAPGTHCPPGGNVKLLTTSHPRITFIKIVGKFNFYSSSIAAADGSMFQ